MNLAYIAYAIAVVIAFLSAGYPGRETWIAAGVFALVGVLVQFGPRLVARLRK